MAVSVINVIKKFFEDGPDARKVEMAEFKALTPQERAELADMAAPQLGLSKQPDGSFA